MSQIFKLDLFNELLITNDVKIIDPNNEDHMILFYFNSNKKDIFAPYIRDPETNQAKNNNSGFYLNFSKKYSMIESKLNSLKRSYDIHKKKKLFNSFIITCVLVYGSSELKSELK